MKLGIRVASVRSRVGLLVGVISTFFLLGTVFMLKTESDLAKSISYTSKSEREHLTDNVVQLIGRQAKSFVFDYTYWDDLVVGIKRKDSNWIKVYIDPNGQAFDVDWVQIYNEKWEPIYSWTRVNASEVPRLELSQLQQLHRHGNPFSHFFVPSGKSVMEIHGGSVHKTADVARMKTVYGHFLVGRRWDARYLDELSSLTSSEASVQLGPRSIASPRIDEETQFVVNRPLPGLNGEAIATVHLVCNEHTLESLKTRHGLALGLVIGFAIIVLATLTYFLLRWVSVPLEQVSRCLRSSDRTHLGSVLKDPTELGEVASLVLMSLDLQDAYKFHNDVLEYRVRERTNALERAYSSTIEGWSRAMDARDHETEGHTKRVSEMAVKLGEALGLSHNDLRRLYH